MTSSSGSSGGLATYGAVSPIYSGPLVSVFKQSGSTQQNQSSFFNKQILLHNIKREIGTQTNEIMSPMSKSRFIRTFSVIDAVHTKHNHNMFANNTESVNTTFPRRKALDDDVLQLIDLCRHYQVIYFLCFIK